MKLFVPIAKVDAEERLVAGYASTEARDDQGEIVKREALQQALADYMRFANIREMHQLSAVGRAKDAAVDDKGLYVAAKVIDDRAWEKVKEGVYNGFSIGGKVLERAAGDPKTITALRLDEISLVDRPANPEAVFDCWKRSNIAQGPGEGRDQPAPTEAQDPVSTLKAAIERLEALMKEGNEPGGEPYGNVEYADPGYQDDNKKRYPLDTETHIRAAWNYIHKPRNAGRYSADELKRIKAKIVAAWKDRIDPGGPPAADDEKKAAQVELRKHLADLGFVAQVILDLDRLKDILATEAIVDGDDSEQPKRLAAIVDELCGFLNALVAEETAEIKSDSEDPGSGPAAGMSDDGDVPVLMSAIAASLRKSGLAGRAKAFEALAKARHSAGDQALLDCAHMAVKAARGIDGLQKAEADHLDASMECLQAAGARESSGIDATQNTGHNPAHPAPQATPPAPQYRPGEYTTWDSSKDTQKSTPPGPSAAILDAIVTALGKCRPFGKRSAAHQALIDIAHDCIGKCTGDVTCAELKVGGRHSAETMERLQEGHDHLVAAGARCGAAGQMDNDKPGGEAEGERTDGDKQDASRACDPGSGSGASLQKRYDDLAKSVAELAPRLDAIMKTVERIEKTPLPPLTRQMDFAATAGLARVEKGRAADEESDEALIARIGAMTPDEQAMLLIKAARMRPRIIPAFGTASPAPTDNSQ